MHFVTLQKEKGAKIHNNIAKSKPFSKAATCYYDTVYDIESQPQLIEVGSAGHFQSCTPECRTHAYLGIELQRRPGGYRDSQLCRATPLYCVLLCCTSTT